MNTNCQYIPYQQTGFFSKMVVDYLHQHEALRGFYQHPVSAEGLQAAMQARMNTSNHRELLVSVLRQQHEGAPLSALQAKHLDNLLLNNTFTITTAHQPNIFTGHLYFIYKIIHAIKMADTLAAQFPEFNFVPVYYMGSEDADLEELGTVTIDGEDLTWETTQTGAVGRMVVDKELLLLIDKIAGIIGIYEFGNKLTDMLKRAYQLGSTIQKATFLLVNELFSEFGLLTLIPDDARLKTPFNSIVKRELTTRFSHKLVEETATALAENYKVQASGREINLFYLTDTRRERIEFENDVYTVKALHKTWSEAEVLQEVDEHPERFSANVILRGVFQEMILPNVAFIGGGGELAYWMELKKVFEACEVPYPVLVLRNSLMLLNNREAETLAKLNLSDVEVFKPEFDLVNQLVNRESVLQLNLTNERNQLGTLYNQIETLAAAIDVTLKDHVISLGKKANKGLVGLERKMLRAEKKKFQVQQRQIAWLKNRLFPKNGLQERVDNFAMYYAMYGNDWLRVLYEHSLTVEQEFAIVRSE